MHDVRRSIPFLLFPLVSVALASPASPVPPEPPRSPAATRVWLAGEDLTRVEFAADKSEPPRFTLAFVREMPTPGWTCHVDAVELDAPGRRISVRLTDVGPQGMTAQVITPTRFEVPLGSVAPGSYFVEIWTRRDPGRDHEPTQALIVTAR